MSRADEGTVRRSQLVTTFGVGALVDLPRRSVIVGGLDHWRPGSPEGFEPVVEPRLSRKLIGFAGAGPPRLYAPPAAEDFPVRRGGSVAAFPFPRWFVAQQPEAAAPAEPGSPRIRPLVHFHDLDERRRYEGKPVVATRFVRACPRGHVDDLDWYWFVHRGDSACRLELSLVERGMTGDLSDIRVRCACGKSRRISDAKAEGPLGPCRGERPWLGKHASEPCGEPARLLVRTASNAWFPQIVSVLSLPDRGSELDRVVAELWPRLQIVLKNAAFLEAVRAYEDVGPRIAPYSDTDLLEAIQRHDAGAAPDRPVKAAELDELLAAPEGFGDDVPVNPDFHARALPRSAWSRNGRFDGVIERVVQVHRLREVMALAGFTRFEAVMPDIDGEYRSDVVRAAITKEQDWLPAVENRGEGIFVLLDPDAVQRWEARPEVQARLTQLAAGHQHWRRQRKQPSAFPGGLYLLAHTVAHLLLQSVALRCGYPAASIRERIYVDAQHSRAGFLLYTASPDAEGTLGGLVAEARRIEAHLAAALEGARLCSNDPVCALHEPGESLEQRWLHGAACHGCTLVAETSCEMRNEYLDRALVAPVIGSSGAAFFGAP